MKYCLDVSHDLVALSADSIYEWDHFPRLDELQKLNIEILKKVKLDEDFRECYLRPARHALDRALASPNLKSTDEPYVAWEVKHPFLLAAKPEPVYFGIWAKQ